MKKVRPVFIASCWSGIGSCSHREDVDLAHSNTEIEHHLFFLIITNCATEEPLTMIVL